jgi:transposase-like protein
MLVKLHANAATTPKVRAQIQSSRKSVAELARELGVSETTIRRWKPRQDGLDRSSRPHVLATRFSLEEEEIAVELRTRLGLSLDDALEVMRRCLRADISRAALHRLLKRRGVSQRSRDAGQPAQCFAPTPFGYVHLDLKHLTRLQGRPAYVVVAIERTTRFVHVEIVENRSGPTIAACFARFLESFGHPVHTVLTDNGSEFTDRFGDARWRTRETGTGAHPFDQVCQPTACATSSPGPTARRPTAWPSASTAASPKPSTPIRDRRPTSAATASTTTPSATPSSTPSSTTTIEPDCDASAIKPPPNASTTSRDTTLSPGRLAGRPAAQRSLSVAQRYKSVQGPR